MESDSHLFTVDDLFDIPGLGLIVMPGPLARDWIGPRELGVRLRLPSGDEKPASMRLDHTFPGLPGEHERLACILKGVTKADVPIGTEVWLEAASDVVDMRSLEQRVRELGRKIGAPDAHLPDFGESRHNGKPHLELGKAFFFVVCERGTEFERRKTDDLDELLFWVFSSVTFSMACDWEVRHRKGGEDSRQQLFAKQEDLLAALSPQWAAREARDHREILKRHPFREA